MKKICQATSKMQYSSLIKFVLLSFFVINVSCINPNRGTVRYGDGGKIIDGQAIVRCDPPRKTYAKELDTQVKAKVGELNKVPASELDAKLKTTIVHLADYSTQGLDMDLIMFRICEMSANRGFTNEQTTELIKIAMNSWMDETKKK